ncbi:MAG: N-acetylmuramoyl-L-alanine amidase [bacterium]|nr:N-acetylmuramoyl-L-alanine amidase [bacterium]
MHLIYPFVIFVFALIQPSISQSQTDSVSKPPIVSNPKFWSKHFIDRQGYPITSIVLHSSFDPKHSYDLRYARIKKVFDRYRVSAHYIIEPNGKIIEMVPITEAAKHATKCKPRDYNLFSIGIELLHVWNGEGSERRAYSLKQLEACRALVRWLKSFLPIQTVVSHRSISNIGKKDPNMTPEEWAIAADGAPFPDPWPRNESSWQPSIQDR